LKVREFVLTSKLSGWCFTAREGQG